MAIALTIAAGRSNSGGAEPATRNEQDDLLHRAVVSCVRKIFPRKTWFELVVLLRISERTAKHRLAGPREFSASELAAMLRSERGVEVLTAIMVGSTPRWWQKFRATQNFA